MKKLLACIALLLTGSLVFAQNKIAEGTITYTVEWTVPAQMQAMAANLPKEFKVYFKGDSSSLKSESAMFSSTSILNTKKEYERMLLDIPMMGKKFSVIFTPDDQEKMLEKMPDLTLKAGTETKTVLGYKALKYDVTEKKSNQNSVAWFTKDVEVTPNSLSRYYDKNYGFPVEFTSFMNEMSVKAVVKEIKQGTVPAGSFSATKDYEEITLDQLMQMSGKR
jgi:GLPGLI family protein